MLPLLFFRVCSQAEKPEEPCALKRATLARAAIKLPCLYMACNRTTAGQHHRLAQASRRPHRLVDRAGKRRFGFYYVCTFFLEIFFKEHVFSLFFQLSFLATQFRIFGISQCGGKAQSSLFLRSSSFLCPSVLPSTASDMDIRQTSSSASKSFVRDETALCSIQETQVAS